MDALKKMAGLKVSRPVTPPADAAVSELQEKYQAAGQGQIFAFWNDLADGERATLYVQLSDIHPEKINAIVEQSRATADNAEDELLPLPEDVCASTLECDDQVRDEWYKLGLQIVSESKAAVIVMAGGQGTRLGSTDPKGCFDIGLPSHKSLFQLQAERIMKIQKLAKTQEDQGNSPIVPWYVMTSGPTRQTTEQYFQANSYFGLNPEDVLIFDQGTLPCVDDKGKIILQSKSSAAIAPDGNGGLYKALVLGGILEDMKRRGIEHIQVYCVDNCLAKVADPIFYGWSASKKLEVSTKVVRKRSPEESVGLVMLRNGKPDVVEYSEIAKSVTEEKESSGLLKFRAANIVQHYFSFNCLSNAPKWATSLPHHIARKKIPYCDTETGEIIKPSAPNGIKLEQFVFDVFPLIEVKKFGCLEVAREDEFSPLKNASGDDSAETSRSDLLRQGARWVRAAGGTSVDDGSEGGNDGVEVSPLVSYGGEGLSGHVKDKEIKGRAYIESART